MIEGVLDNDVVFRDPTAIDEDGFPRDSTLGQLLRDEMEETEEVQPLIQDETAGSQLVSSHHDLPDWPRGECRVCAEWSRWILGNRDASRIDRCRFHRIADS